MKNKLGLISGFVLGIAGFLFLFKIIILDNTPPEDELAPGIVLFASIMNGFLFGFIGSQIQHYITKRRNYKV